MAKGGKGSKAKPSKARDSSVTVASSVDEASAVTTTAAAAPATNKPNDSPLKRLVIDSTLSIWLVVLASLVGVVWFCIELFVIDVATQHEQYGRMLTPRSLLTYDAWGIAMWVVLVLEIAAVCIAASDIKKKYERFAVRRALYVAGALLVLALGAGNVFRVIETAARRKAESAYAIKYNEFYCHARTVRVCMDGDTVALLQLTRGSNATVQSRENVTDAALAVWSRCQQSIKWAIEKTPKVEEYSVTYTAAASKYASPSTTYYPVDKTGVLEINTNPLYAFLLDSGASIKADAWCGDASLRTTAMTDAEQRTLPSPFAANPKMFDVYTREWTKRMTVANAMLGVTTACFVLAGVALKVADTIDPRDALPRHERRRRNRS